MATLNMTQFDPTSDVARTTTLLHEVIPLTGTIVSGTYTYSLNWTERNIKNYTHGMFQSVYDYPYLSSSSNHIFDITACYSNTSDLSGSSVGAGPVQNAKKINMYNQFAQVLMGYTSSDASALKRFESDLDLDNTNIMFGGYFLTFSRLLVKDQIRRNSFSITVGNGAWATPFASTINLTDASASYNGAGGVKNTVGGDYGVLYDTALNKIGKGIIFYQAGVVFLTSSLFSAAQFLKMNSSEPLPNSVWTSNAALSGTAISASCNALRHRIQNVSFNNTTEINSSIYFCRVKHNQYNYSSNPTYVTGSKIRVKNQSSDQPVAYITTVGLYNSANELLATAKLSEPLRKDPNTDLTIRVRLAY